MLEHVKFVMKGGTVYKAGGQIVPRQTGTGSIGISGAGDF